MSPPAPGPVQPVADGRIVYRWIDRQGDLDDLVETLIAEPRYALDTEFHRERTYFPKLALVQVAWRSAEGQELALIDPLAVDVTPFDKLFASDALCVIHAAQQDLDVLTHAVGSVPSKMFDTQLAAGFVGYGTPSLVSLLQGEIGVSPPKGDRLTDWLRRPLTDSQCQYAAADVEYLLDLHERLVAQLAEAGRLAWADDACEELRTRPTSGSAPEDAWMRLKDARSLRPSARAVAQSVAAWRERRAMRTDVPVRQVLPDLAILGISQRAPSSNKELSQARGVDERHSRGGIAEEILDAVRAAKGAPPPTPPPSADDLDRNMRPAVTLVSAWVGQLARDERLDPTLLATRADIVSFLRGDDDARLGTGWRNELVGDGIRRLVGGEAGLTFDPEGRLRLHAVSD
jgi:ribonuclease D